MLLQLWHYLHGYVMIKTSGFATSRLMNMLSFRGVYLWDVMPEGVGLSMKVPLGSLSIVEACATKTGCTLEIKGYGGLPAKLSPYRKRQALTFGVLFFACGLYLLSSFIWTIKIEGNERVSNEEILAYCKDLGLSAGAWKANVNPDTITNSLLLEFGDISWVSVGITGTDVTIKIAETIRQTELVDKETPSNVVATADGVITKITAERGTPLVKEGDIVKKGDVLISSEILVGLEGEEQHTDYVLANGSITAKMWQRITEELPLSYSEKVLTGEEESNLVFQLWGKQIDILRPSLTENAEVTIAEEKQLSLGDFSFPLAYQKELYQYYILEEKTRTVEMAKDELAEILEKKASQLLSPYGTIEHIEVKYEVYSDLVRAVGEVTYLDEIGTTVTVEKGRDAVDGTNRESVADGE